MICFAESGGALKTGDEKVKMIEMHFIRSTFTLYLIVPQNFQQAIAMDTNSSAIKVLNQFIHSNIF